MKEYQEECVKHTFTGCVLKEGRSLHGGNGQRLFPPVGGTGQRAGLRLPGGSGECEQRCGGGSECTTALRRSGSGSGSGNYK